MVRRSAPRRVECERLATRSSISDKTRFQVLPRSHPVRPKTSPRSGLREQKSYTSLSRRGIYLTQIAVALRPYREIFALFCLAEHDRLTLRGHPPRQVACQNRVPVRHVAIPVGLLLAKAFATSVTIRWTHHRANHAANGLVNHRSTAEADSS